MPDEFPSLLTVARGRAHLSQRELATRAGVDPSFIPRLEAGSRHPGREVVEALADAMSMDSYSRAMLLCSAGYVPLNDQPFRQLVATVAAFWAKKNLAEVSTGPQD